MTNDGLLPWFVSKKYNALYHNEAIIFNTMDFANGYAQQSSAQSTPALCCASCLTEATGQSIILSLSFRIYKKYTNFLATKIALKVPIWLTKPTNTKMGNRAVGRLLKKINKH